MKYRIIFTLYICTCGQVQVNRNFQLVLNEMGPGWTSQAWYFHSPGLTETLVKLNRLVLTVFRHLIYHWLEVSH